MPKVLFRAIRTRSGYPNWPNMRRELEREIDRRIKPDLLAYFNKIVADWKHKPKFKARKRITSSGITISVYPTGKHANIWKYVSWGTKPHIIRPKHAKALRFQWAGPGSYKPRTSTSGGYKGPGKATGPIVYRQEVHHPGTKARNFEKHIARWYMQEKPNFRQRMENALRRGARRL